jgi:formylglycine-generating enzyme required for sulfatase activity
MAGPAGGVRPTILHPRGLRYRVPAAFLVFYVKQTISVHSSMSSLADAPDLVGFFSYSREDDEDSGGKLSKLRERIQAGVRGQLGRTKRDFRLWQDKTAIAYGELWEDRIKSAVAESVFFIPIITPTAVRSYHCKFEFESFLAREKELGRNNLVFPILYIPVPALTGDRWRQDPLLAVIGSRQYEQWQDLRHLDVSSPQVELRVIKFCANICRALQQEWLSPEERQQADARRVAETERRRQQEAEIKQRADEEERRRKAEAEERRRDEEERRRQEAEIKRRLDEAETENQQNKEQRKLEKEATLARPFQWRGVAVAGAAAAMLLLVALIALTKLSPWVPWAVQPERTERQGEQQRQAALKEEEQRQPKATAEPKTDPALSVRPGSSESFRDVLVDGNPCPFCPEMVVAPVGEFMMGSNPKDDPLSAPWERPQHLVSISHKFAVGKFAVTFDEWNACVAEGACPKKVHSGLRPVTDVKWEEAKAYVAWLSRKTGKSYRLLTEAEREYITRAGTTTPFSTGSGISTNQANYNGEKKGGLWRKQTVPVASFAPNAWGLYQVHGNVYEWVEDCAHKDYGGTPPSDGSAWLEGKCDGHMLRGGSWTNAERFLRSAHRSSAEDKETIGLRVARTIAP